MGRDYKAYHYTHIGFRRDEMLEELQAEAKERGVAFSQHLVDLLRDRHKAKRGEGNGLWFPRGTPIPQPVQVMLNTTAPDIAANLSAFTQFLDDDDMPTQPRMAALRKE